MSTIASRLSAATIAGAFAAALGSLAATPAAADMAANIAKTETAMKTGKFDLCYGVALKGQNDCAAGVPAGSVHSCAAMSTVDYDPKSFKLVPVGTCTTMKTPTGMGSLKAM